MFKTSISWSTRTEAVCQFESVRPGIAQAEDRCPGHRDHKVQRDTSGIL